MRTLILILLAATRMHAADRAWIAYGPTGPIARALVSGDAACPSIEIDGRAVAMRKHAEPAKAYPFTVCEAAVPTGTQSLSIDKVALPAAKIGHAAKVAILGDTVCRRKAASKDYPALVQDCSDPKAWPFAAIVGAIDAWNPDVVIHVGDYYYREAACADEARCTPLPFDWSGWDADFFTPAAPLLAHAPWIFLRGNHENCKRAAEGWFRFLDPRDYVWEDGKTCTSNWTYTPPYVVALEGLSVAVADSSAAKAWDAQQAADYAGQLAQLAKAPAGTWLALHHPLWAIDETDPVTQTLWTSWTQAGAATAPVGLVVTGHIHALELLTFDDHTVPQVVAGVGGTALAGMAEKGPGTTIGPRTVSTITAAEDFGFIAATPSESGWTFDVRTTTGASKMKCAVTKSAIVCD